MSDQQGPDEPPSNEPGPDDPGFHGQDPPFGQPPPGQPPGQYGQPGPYGQDYGQPYGQPGYGQPGYGGYGGANPSTNRQNANLALALSVGGLLSYVVGACCFVFGFLGPVLSGVGAVMGTKELREIDAGLADPNGRSAAKAAQVVGAIGVGLFVLGLLAVIVFIAIGSVSS